MQWPQQNSGDQPQPTPRPGPYPDAPPLFSATYSGSAFPAAASAPIVSEHPCVTLVEWWLARVEGHEQKLAVGGFFERNQAVLDFPAVPIAKCHDPYVLESENGTIVTIYGKFNIDQTLENGFTIEACKRFSLGFPQLWEKWMLYPNMTRSQTVSESICSSISNSDEDALKFYLEMFQKGKQLDSLGAQILNARNKAEAFSGRDHAFADSSSLPNGAARFEEYISDNDTPLVSAASNHDGNEVKNMEIVLTGAKTFKEGQSHEHIFSNVPSASMVECTNGEGNVGVGNALSINNGLQKTLVSSFKRQCCLKKPRHVALSESVPGESIPTLPSSEKGEQPVGSSRKQRYAFGKLQRATRSSKIICPSPDGNVSPLIHGWPKSLSLSTPESLKLKKTRSGRVVVPPLDPGCQNIIYAPDGSISAISGLDSPPPLKGSILKNYARKKKRSN